MWRIRNFSTGNLAASILVLVAVLACSPASPPTQTPGVLQSTPIQTTAASGTSKSHVADSGLAELLNKMPLSLTERGMWFGDNERALELADAQQPQSVEEVRALSEAELDHYLDTLRRVVQVADFGHSRGQPQEWKEIFGIDQFAIAKGARTGGQSGDPIVLAYVEGDIDPATVQQRLQALGYEDREVSGIAYQAIPKDFHSPGNPASLLAANRMDHVFTSEGVLMAAPKGGMLADILKVRAGTAPSMADDPRFLAIGRSLGDPLSAVMLTRKSVLEPEHLPALFYDKPTGWGILNEWGLFAIGYGVSGKDRLLTLSLYYPDPDDAAEDAGELKRRIPHYTTIVPQLLPGAPPQLAEGWPEKPYLEMCGPLTSSISNDETGSILTIRCTMKNETSISWWELVDMRDLGFLLP